MYSSWQVSLPRRAGERAGLTEYRATLLLHPNYGANGHDDAIAEATQSAYKHAAYIVARQAGINLRPVRENVEIVE